MKKEKPKPKRKFRPSDNTQYLTVAGGAILVLLVTFALNDFAGPTQDTWGMVIASVGGLGVMILPLLLHIILSSLPLRLHQQELPLIQFFQPIHL